MNQKRFWSLIFLALGLCLLVTAIRGVAAALRQEHVPPAAYFTYAAGFFFGTCLVLGALNCKRLCALSGALSVLSLMGLDLAKWRAGQQSLGSVLLTWGIIAAFLTFAFFVLGKRSRKDTNAT